MAIITDIENVIRQVVNPILIKIFVGTLKVSECTVLGDLVTE